MLNSERYSATFKDLEAEGDRVDVKQSTHALTGRVEKGRSLCARGVILERIPERSVPGEVCAWEPRIKESIETATQTEGNKM